MQLDPSHFPRLMARLGENTRTVIPFHFLKRRRARVWADDAWGNVVIETGVSEPMAFIFGEDADWQAELIAGLPRMRLYWCPVEAVQRIFPVVTENHGGELILEPDIQRTVTRHMHIPAPEGVQVRRLSAADLPVLAGCSPDVAWLRNAWYSWEELLEEGVVIAALVDGRMVSGAVTFARAGRMDDIGVATEAQCQCRGLSSACASMLVEQILAQGRQPVWTVFLSNIPSVRISDKLGFVTHSECMVIRRKPEDDDS